MEYSIDCVTNTVKELKLKGDKAIKMQNYHEALDLYRKAHEYRMKFFAEMDLKNSSIYKRLALALSMIDSNECNDNITILAEAKMYAKLYIKIRFKCAKIK